MQHWANPFQENCEKQLSTIFPDTRILSARPHEDPVRIRNCNNAKSI
jgi:hypothetical protein